MSQTTDPSDEPHDPPSLPPPVGLPRRFGLSKVMLLMALFALVFGLMRWLEFSIPVFIGTAAFFCAVGGSQALFYAGREPRKASFMGGVMFGPLVGLGCLVLADWMLHAGLLGDEQHSAVHFFAWQLVFFGGPLGYVAGCLVAGVFLIKERDQAPEE